MFYEENNEEGSIIIEKDNDINSAEFLEDTLDSDIELENEDNDDEEPSVEMNTYLKDWRKRFKDAVQCSGNSFIDDDYDSCEYSV